MYSMVTVYILELNCGKYYVGNTNESIDESNLGRQIGNHFRGNGALWTKKWLPLGVYGIFYNCAITDVDKHVIKMMKKVGINSVRGGSFCDVELQQFQINRLKKMLQLKEVDDFVVVEDIEPIAEIQQQKGKPILSRLLGMFW